MKASRKAIGWSLALLAALGAGGWGVYRYRQPTLKKVSVDAIRVRDLDAVVSASGKIQPKRSVNISADTMGRVTTLAVREGERVARGQFLLQIDPRNLQTAVSRNEASLAAAESQLSQAKASLESSRDNLSLARENLKRQRDLWAAQLSTREALDRAETEVKLRESEFNEREHQVSTQANRIAQERAVVAGARYDLSKVRIESPIDGIVTRRNIEEGETVVIGTMNNAGTVLLTIADMSVIEAELEVDETDIPSLSLGQAVKVTIDAIADKTFTGRVTEIGNSPIQTTGATQTAQNEAINFKVKVTIAEEIPDVRPGFTCSADITTASRTAVVAVPIQALTVREMVFDQAGQLVRQPPRPRGSKVEPTASAEELPTGQTRKESEGVFVLRNGRAEFVPVKTGIAGERYFEVLGGVQAGDQVITGPLDSVRDLADGDEVALEDKTKKPATR
ncbi:MAG: efflux RND transporter periplasmic adaptor subunit [Vicinamibacterales bacterium]